MKLLKNCNVYNPDPAGMQDILIAGEKIVAMANSIDTPTGVQCEVFDMEGATVMPGLVDAHVHIAGAGGEGGPATRTPEMQLSSFIKAGVTTVVGCLGTDGLTRNPESVLMKAKGLKAEGISAWMWIGAYQVPTPTFLGDVGRDIALIEEVVGVGEIALSDHRSSWPNTDELLKLTEHARVGGMLGGKAGIINIHLGDQEDPFIPLYEVIERSKNMLKLSQFLPTHCNRNDYTLESSIELAKKGGLVDITSSSYPYFPEYEVKPSKSLAMLLKAGIDISQITFTSDAGGSLPGFDEQGNLIKLEMGSPDANMIEILDAVHNENVPFETAIKVMTSNPARILKLHGKGQLKEGFDADIVVLKDQTISHVIARGQWMMQDEKILKKGSYEA
ncbi:MAG: beta-aspartyl-peptidase [Marinilabiliales bacterium]|nr:MAG: beta-aspartyl-peptidase [Marinilabiliales bacterium]